MQKRQGTYLYPTKEQVDSFKSQISLSTHHHHLHTFENSFTGKQAMKIIRNIDKAFADYDQAMQFGNLMILAGVIEPLNFRHHRFFSPKSKFIYTKGQGEGFENLFWLYHDEEEGPASLSMEDYKEEVFDSELSEEERNNLKQIPSAGGIPIAGVALKLATPGDMNRSMQRLGRELCPKVGGIFKMTLMNNKFVVVSDPDIVETVFVSDNFGKKTEHDTFFHELRVFRGEGLSSASDGCVHNQCAGVIAPQLVKKCFEKYVPTVLSVIHDSLQEVREKGSFEARPFFSKIMTRIIGFVTLGFDLYGDPEWMKFVDGITFVADQSVNRAFKASKYVPNHAIKFKKTVEQMNNLLMNFVKDRREKLKKIPKPKEEYDMLDLLITTPIAENDGTKIYMSDELIRANLETIISAQNTTTSMLSWTLNFLYDWELGNSSYLYKLIQEVDNISQGDRDYQPTLDDVYKRMTFMTNVLWESLRLCPPIPTVIRHCIKTCNVGGYLVRRGTTVMVSALGTHLNPKSFDDPFTYNPDRWSKPNVKKKPCSFVVWAAGKRQCVGREFALLTGRMALFCLLNQFALEMSPKAKVVTNEHLFVFPDGLIMNAKPRPNVEPLEPKQKQQENEKKESREEDSVPDANWDGIVNLIQHEQYKMVILKGTNSSGGTVETVSDWFVKKSQKLGFDTEDSPIELNEFLHHVKDQKPDKFSIWGLVVASYNGKPAKNANLFYEWLQEKAESGEDKEYLKHIRYFVFGCGSTNWVATYRKIPNSFDDWMQALGATRIDVPAEFNEAEDELEDVFSDYYKNLLPKLMHKLPAIGEQKLQSVNKENGGENGGNPNSEDFSESLKLEAQKSSSAIQMEVIGTVDDVDVDFIHSACDLEESEFELCKIKKIFNITPNSDRATIGIELERNSLEYETGDHLVVYPIQRKEYAERVIQHFVDYDLETVVTFEKFQSANKSHFRLPVGKNISVENILLSIVDLKRKPNKAFMMNYSVIVDNEEHKEKLQSFANDRKLFKKWLHEHEPVSIVDVIEMFPPQKENFDRLLEILPILEPRKFSITSSPNVHKNEIHLCAAAERVEFENGVYEGICSQYWDSLLNENGTKVYCKVEKADESFRIPDDEKPMILISAGTGFAPMRGFLHERKFREAKGKNIVIFGCRTEENDLLYREELQEWKKSGFADIYFAFSRSEGCKKKYVQDVIKEQKDLLWELVDEKGAFVFVCGNGSTMAVGVRDAFLEFIQEHCPHDEKDHEQWANDYLSNLEKHNRYEIDVWG